MLGLCHCYPLYILITYFVNTTFCLDFESDALATSPRSRVHVRVRKCQRSCVTQGNMLLLGPLVLNALPGAKYGIPFPVLARSAFGRRGAIVAVMCRGLVSITPTRMWRCALALWLLLPLFVVCMYVCVRAAACETSRVV